MFNIYFLLEPLQNIHLTHWFAHTMRRSPTKIDNQSTTFHPLLNIDRHREALMILINSFCLNKKSTEVCEIILCPK